MIALPWQAYVSNYMMIDALKLSIANAVGFPFPFV